MLIRIIQGFWRPWWADAVKLNRWSRSLSTTVGKWMYWPAKRMQLHGWANNLVRHKMPPGKYLQLLFIQGDQSPTNSLWFSMRLILNYINNGFEQNESMNVYTILMNSSLTPECRNLFHSVRSSATKTLQVLTFLVLLRDRYHAFIARQIHHEYEFYRMINLLSSLHNVCRPYQSKLKNMLGVCHSTTLHFKEDKQ